MKTIDFRQSKKYQIIYADPPWFYSDNKKHGASKHYSMMKTEQIMKLPIDALADENCCLFLWVTMPLLQDGLNVMKAWGFHYTTCAFTWVKLNPDDKPFIGMGNYTRQNSELCLLGLKGKMEVQSHDVSSVIQSIRGKHSQKPAETRDRIVRLFGNLSRVELFARQAPDGWDTWGNELDTLLNMEQGNLESMKFRIGRQIDRSVHGWIRNKIDKIRKLIPIINIKK
jgi:N6-adenosine-specific RNA methylase IME4